MATCGSCYKRMKAVVSGIFRRYGEIVGRYPWPFIILPILICIGLGVGLLTLEEEKNLETVYFPKDSRAIKNRQYVRDTFPDLNNQSYNPFSQSEPDNAANIIFETKKGQSIFNSSVTDEITTIVAAVKNLKVSGKNYSDFCAMFSNQCVVDGEQVLTSVFQAALTAGSVTYPSWNSLNLETCLSDVTINGGILVSATVLKLSFKLAEDAEDWKEKFLEYAQTLDPNQTEVTYEIPESLNKELDKSTNNYIYLFLLTIVICCIYASIVATGGNPVSTRSMLALAGILAAIFSILGSMGLLCVCGVKFVGTVGIIPLLIIGIGVDDMFLMMSSWSENLPSEVQDQTVDHVPIILGKTLASAGIGITITSLTDFLAFIIGTTSVFQSITNFSLYAGVAVLFCYLTNVTLFCGCLAIHGRRVYSSRNSFTCLKTKSQDDLKNDGKSACFAVICGGSPPKGERDDESLFEKVPSKYLHHLPRKYVVSIVIIFCFLCYLAASIYGTVHLEQGLNLQNLVPDSSYYYKYIAVYNKYFPVRLPIGFVVNEELDYYGNDGTLFLGLLQEARLDSGINSNFEKCWLSSFKNSSYYKPANSTYFISDLRDFLAVTPEFQSDVVFDNTYTKIIASRCFVMSEANNDYYENADLMKRMYDIADASSFSVFAYHSSFVTFEQFLAVLPATLMMVGCAVAVMTVVTFIFLPHVLMVLLVVLTIVMILVGIFGSLYFWDLTLSSITMIHLVMSVGFSVDFSAHVCAAYLMSDSSSRKARAQDAIRHAAGPILNGATSTLLGIIVLVSSKSFIFLSFFKIMFVVILFGMLHGVFFLPAVLSLIGPENKETIDEHGEPTSHKSDLGLFSGLKKRLYPNRVHPIRVLPAPASNSFGLASRTKQKT